MFTPELSDFMRVQIFFYSCIINPQELCSSGHGVNVEMLSFCSFLIHETEYRIVGIPVNKDHGGDFKQHLTQVRRTAFGNMTILCIKCTGLIRWCFHTSIGNQRAFVRKTAHIPNLRHHLRPWDFHNPSHRHTQLLCGQQGRHLTPSYR